MNREFSWTDVAVGTLIGLLMSRLFYVRMLSATPSGTRRRFPLVGGSLLLVALAIWLSLSNTGDILVHLVSRRVPDAVNRMLFVGLQVIILDLVVTATAKALGRKGTG